MEQRIVQVAPTEDYFSITWKLSIRCNYDCMYCPTKWHDTTSPHHSLETLQQAWTSIYEKTKHTELPYKIAFTGGEVTGNKNFLPFVEWLRANYADKIFMLLVTTNGSATFKYYSNLFNSIDNISFSVHSEHIDEQKFFNMIIDLKKSIDSDRFLHVNIMNEFWNQDRIVAYCKLLTEHGVSHNVNEIDYELQTRKVPLFNGKLNLEI
jgi:organic radical activating enzyme